MDCKKDDGNLVNYWIDGEMSECTDGAGGWMGYNISGLWKNGVDD